MARAGAVFIDVLPSMAGWNTAVRAQAAVSLEGVGTATGKGYMAGLMRAIKGGGMAEAVGAQAKVAADRAAMAVEQASAKVAAARKREADASGAVRVAELKLAELRAKENTSASSLAAAEERLARAQRTQASAAEASVVANKGLVAAQARAAEATAAVSTESAVATGRFSAMGAAVTGGATRMTSKIGGLAKGVAAMGGLFAGFEVARFAGESLHAAMDFQKGSQVLQTAAGELPRNMAMVRSGLMAISSETGTSLDQMVEGMYTVEKAGIRGSKGLDVMRAAAKGAKDEGADLGVVTNALTTVMTTSNGKITDASKAMNAVMVAAGHSKTTLQEFAGSLSSVLPLASKVGISFAQVSGAISTMTAQGMSAQQSTQDLNHVIASLATPTKMMATEMAAFGINADNVRDKLGKRGLQGTIEYLSDSIKNKMGSSAKHALEQVKNLPAEAQALAGQYQHGLLTTSQFMSKVGKLKFSGVVAGDTTAARTREANATDALRLAEMRLAALRSKSHVSATSLAAAEMAVTHAQRSQAAATAAVAKASQGKTKSADAPQSVKDTLLAAMPAMRGYTQALSKMTGGQMGLTTSLMLTGQNAKQFTEATKDVGKAVNSTEDFDKKWGITSKSTANQLAIAKQTISNVGTALATNLLPGISKAAMWFATATMATSRFTKQNWSWLGPVAKGFGLIVGALVALATVAKVAAAAQWLLNTALVANPIGLVVVAIVAFVAALVLAYNKVDWFRKFVNYSFGLIVQGGQQLWDGLKAVFKFIVDMWFTVEGALINGAAKAFGWVPGLGGKLKSAAAAFGNFRDSVNNALDGIHPVKDITLKVTTQQAVANPSISKPRVIHPWTGGRIVGPGTGTSDSIPAMVSNGEYVIRAAAVDHYGAGFFDQLNNMHYANGGRVLTRNAPQQMRRNTRQSEGGVNIYIDKVVPRDYSDFMGQMQTHARNAGVGGVSVGGTP